MWLGFNRLQGYFVRMLFWGGTQDAACFVEVLFWGVRHCYIGVSLSLLLPSSVSEFLSPVVSPVLLYLSACSRGCGCRSYRRRAFCWRLLLAEPTRPFRACRIFRHVFLARSSTSIHRIPPRALGRSPICVNHLPPPQEAPWHSLTIY